MPEDSPAPKVSRATAGMTLAVWDGKHVLFCWSYFHQVAPRKIQCKCIMQNVDMYFVNFQMSLHV